jgi:spoIIIJ-associated protein
MDSEKIVNLVRQSVEALLPLMMVDAEVTYTFEQEGETPSVKVDFDGQDLGYLIGNRGTHLKSFQFITSLMVNRAVKLENPEAMRIFVNMDVAGYRQERISAVEDMARAAADRAIESGEPVDMHPMSPADRRIVHMVLSTYENIVTESHGEDRDRFVRVLVK